MKYENVEQNTGVNRKEERKKDVKSLINPFISYYIHIGATSLGQVRISPKVLLSNRLYLPCAICWPYVVHLLP